MAKIKGMTAKIKDWMVTVLAALKDADGDKVFKTAAIDSGQLKSGTSSYTSLAPFAFVIYFTAQPTREGDGDLNDRLRFAVLIGFESKHPDVARDGDDGNLGASRARDLVIDAFDKKHPGQGFDCDELEYDGEQELVDIPKYYSTFLFFKCNRIR